MQMFKFTKLITLQNYKVFLITKENKPILQLCLAECHIIIVVGKICCGSSN